MSQSALSPTMPVVEASCVTRMEPDVPRITAAGSGALLLDPSHGTFDATIQQRLFALAARLRAELPAMLPADSACEVVPGVNNLLLVFDSLALHPDEARALLARWWNSAEPAGRDARDVEIPVVYGGEAGADLADLARRASLDLAEYVRRHSAAVYTVACIGSMPGFAYLTGLPDALFVPRRSAPRMKVAQGTVIVGASQAGVMPCSAPSGWHTVGRTDLTMFDPLRASPCLLAPGDRVHFRIAGIAA